MTNIDKLFEEFNDKKILVIGDVMIDSYMWGKTDRISPEAPVPVVSVTSKENRMGGAANVGINIKALGAEPILCAIIGNDDYGKSFNNLLARRKMTDKGLMKDGNRPTTVKTRIIAASQHLLRVDEEETKPIDAGTAKRFVEHVRSLIESEKPHAIIFEDYDKGNITPKVIHPVVEMANEKNIPVLVDPKKRNFLEYKNVTLFKPNFKELVEGLKIEADKRNNKEVLSAINQLRATLNSKYVMVTLSEAGVMISDGKEYFHMPAQKREIADVSGAGDTVISVLSVCMASNMSPQNSATIANIAGGLVCEKVGVVPIDKEQLFIECKKIYPKNHLL